MLSLKTQVSLSSLLRYSGAQPCFSVVKLETKVDQFASNVDPDEVADNKPPHLDLHCLPSSL